MKAFLKVVTVLLISLGALPISALIPCQEKMPPGAHCAPGCAGMMAMEMEDSGASSHLRPAGAGNSCCRALPRVPVARATVWSQRMNRESRDTALVVDAIAGLAPHFILDIRDDRRPPGRASQSPTQSRLCTFLI